MEMRWWVIIEEIPQKRTGWHVQFYPSLFSKCRWVILSLLLLTSCNRDPVQSPLQWLQATRPWDSKVIIVKNLEIHGISATTNFEPIHCKTSEEIHLQGLLESGQLSLDGMTTYWNEVGSTVTTQIVPGAPSLSMPAATIFQLPRKEGDNGVLSSVPLQNRQKKQDSKLLRIIRGSFQAPEHPGTYVLDIDVYNNMVEEDADHPNNGWRVSLFRRELIVE